MPRILIISSCTARKGFTATRADRLYEGEHHRRLMHGVDALRAESAWDVDLRIVSAKYGLLSGADIVPPYDETFSGMGRRAVRQHAAALGIPDAVHGAMRAPVDLTLIALGDDYLTAIGFETTAMAGAGVVVLLCAPAVGRRLTVGPNVRKVVVGVSESRRFHCGFIGLKGEVAGRLLMSLASDPTSNVPDWATSESMLDRLTREDPQLVLAA